MAENIDPPKWPALIEQGLSAIGRGVFPDCVRALNRLIGAGVDVPAAKLAQWKARIEAQTQSFTSVEDAIAKAVVAHIGTDEAMASRAANVLIQKAYRQQVNREAIAVVTLAELAATSDAHDGKPRAELNESWMTLFERLAEDASSEHMQKLWGRVLAGQIRTPGQYSLRTLRFLSEFSQDDALAFSEFALMAFGEFSPRTLVRPVGQSDIRDLVYLEAIGVIRGASGAGLRATLAFDERGSVVLAEGDIAIEFRGSPGTRLRVPVVALTPVGQELLRVLPERDVHAAARRFAHAIRQDGIQSAYLGHMPNGEEVVTVSEVLWENEANAAVSPQAAAPDRDGS